MASVGAGKVFPDRYHAQIIRTPRQARHALAYVLNNWRKHGENKLADRKGLADRSVLERAELSWLEGRRGKLARVATDLRAPAGVGAQDVAVARGLEEARLDLVEGSPESQSERAGDGTRGVRRSPSLSPSPGSS